MDIKDLIKAIDTEGVLDKETTATLIKNAEDSILAKCTAAKEEGKAEGKIEALEEAKCKIEDAAKLAYTRGVKESLQEAESLIKEAEANGFQAGVTEALKEAEALAEEYDAQVKEAVKELAETYDKYVESNLDIKVKETEEAVTDKVVESLDKYLNTYISEVIPESVVIDYDRIQKLEKTFQVLKESLIVTEEDVQAKMKQLDESTVAELEKTRNALKSEVQKRIIIESKINEQEAKILLTEKTADLPAYEKNILMKKFTGCSVKEINESFEDTLTKIKDELITETEAQKTTVSETIVTEGETKETEKPAQTEITESKETSKVEQRMAQYANLAGRKSSYCK